MPKPSSKTKSAPKKVTTAAKTGLSQATKNWITIILLLMYFSISYMGLIGIVLNLIGVILMWKWTSWKKWLKIVITIPFVLMVALPPIFLAVYIFAYRPYMVSGDAMMPNYSNGEYVMTTIQRNGSTAIKRNDVIVFVSPTDNKKDFIKRVIGLPGETVMIKEGSVYINGKKLDESAYVTAGIKTDPGQFLKEGETKQVPPRSYFVLGDNRQFSSDSREWGFLSQKKIISFVDFCYWNCK